MRGEASASPLTDRREVVTGRTAAALAAFGGVDVDLVTGIAGKPQPVHASIELRRPGRPITIESTFSDLDLGPIIAAFAPGAASSVTGMLNGRLYLNALPLIPLSETKFESTGAIAEFVLDRSGKVTRLLLGQTEGEAIYYPDR